MPKNTRKKRGRKSSAAFSQVDLLKQRVTELCRQRCFSTFIGVDPGKDGAVAIVTEMGSIFTVQTKEDPLHQTLSRYNLPPSSTLVLLEHVHAVFGSRANATFSFGESSGFWKGFFASKGIIVLTCPPKDWQYGVGMRYEKKIIPKGCDRKTRQKLKDENKLIIKTESIRVANTHSDLQRISHDGVADAVNLAFFLRNLVSTCNK